jgi:hypothetical protein
MSAATYPGHAVLNHWVLLSHAHCYQRLNALPHAPAAAAGALLALRHTLAEEKVLLGYAAVAAAAAAGQKDK